MSCVSPWGESMEALHLRPSQVFLRVSLHLAVPDFILYKKGIVSIALLSLAIHSSE